MFTMRRIGAAFMVVGLLGVSASTYASGEGAGHGAPKAAGHGAADGGEAGHADGAHHACYDCDDDKDGTANWLDGDSPDYMAAKLGFHGANLAILIGALVFFAGPGIRDAVRAHALTVRRELDEAAKLKAEAAAHHEAVARRLAALSDEVKDLQARAGGEAQAEEQRILQRAQDSAARVADNAQRQIRDEAARARAELRREAVEIAVQLAETILKNQVGPQDQRQLAREFLETIQREGVAHG
jgi:F-type H+-transporting ATPase subunit b